MKPGTNRIVWGLCSLALCTATIIVAHRFNGSDSVYGFGGDMAFWLFLAASTVVGGVGAFLLFIGARERNQFRRTMASISREPPHRSTTPAELVTRITTTLAATCGDLTDEMLDALRRILSRLEGQPVASAAVANLFPGAVSGDIASEVLAAADWLDAEAKDFILESCYLLIEAMDDPGPAQEELLVRLAAAMGLSELDLSELFDRFESEDIAASRFGAANHMT